MVNVLQVYKVADMVADMEVDKVADMVADMEVDHGGRHCGWWGGRHGGRRGGRHGGQALTGSRESRDPGIFNWSKSRDF